MELTSAAGRAALVRLVLLVVTAGVVLLGWCTWVLGRDAVAMAPVLAPYRNPLYLAAAVGAGLVLAAVVLAWNLVVDLVDTVDDRGPSVEVVARLRRLRVLVGCTGGHLAVCVVGMQVVLAPLDLGMPGVWLAGVFGEVVVVALVVGLGVRQRHVEEALAYRRRQGLPV